MNRPSWHEYFLMLAKLVSVRSTCNSRKIGAVIVRSNRILATGYNGAVHGAPHCIDRGPDFCLRRSIGAHDADKYNYCLSSHAEVNAIDQAARFGIPLENAVLYCTLEPCNWCFKQLIQAGIREIYFEEFYDSKNKEFDIYWRGIMESHEGISVFQQVSISPETLEMVFHVLSGSSARNMPATSPQESGDMDMQELVRMMGPDLGKAND
ncbi:MAG: dCMP deaminase family protein [Desulfomonile tiedjei]|uniref:dCMP deaminase family protein n=1 Tax=Desulfomonile tiedjei TaxID=2358 RepID=A0A9D6V4X0_9BACT|nr:dCMP deaminase family protein [Desulfomonile tiedjei]